MGQLKNLQIATPVRDFEEFAERERAFQAEMRERRAKHGPWGTGTLTLPVGKSMDNRLFEQGLQDSLRSWANDIDGKPTWPEGGPQTSSEDFSPERL